MRKKFFALLLSTAMVVTSLAACGSNSDGAEPTKAPEQADTQVVSDEAPAPTLAEPEAITKDAVYHFTFDGAEDGVKTVVRTDNPGLNTGATYGIEESATYVDKEQVYPATVQYVNGPVGKCAYINGKFGLKLDVQGFEKDEYTISFWMNADRLSTFGASLQIGSNIGMSDVEKAVKWINFTQSEWGANSAKIFPVVWNRNSETGAFPWVYAADDSIHGKKEWVLVTLVATGNIYNYADDGYDRNACKLYLDGVLAFDAGEGAYGGLATDIMKASDNFECYFGINYWDSLFKGYVDDLYIFDYALTDGQVASLYLLGDVTKAETVDTTLEPIEAEPTAQVVTNITSDAISYIGTTTCDNGFWTSFSDGYAVPEGGSVNLKFRNCASGLSNWHNYVLAFANTATTKDLAPSPDNYAGYAEYGAIRADSYGWGYVDAQFTYDWGWDQWNTFMQDVIVDAVISKNGKMITIDATLTTTDGKVYTYKVSMETTATETSPVYVFITNEASYIELLSVK